MKLRNKKTGEIKEGVEISVWLDREGTLKFTSLAELNDEWEDYEPKEPLIKDENVRETVRAWAKANNIKDNLYGDTAIKFNPSEHRFTWIDTSIEFDEIIGLENLKNRKRYTIAELCGEEEE